MARHEWHSRRGVVDVVTARCRDRPARRPFDAHARTTSPVADGADEEELVRSLTEMIESNGGVCKPIDYELVASS